MSDCSDIERIIARLNVNRVSPRELQQLGYSLNICNSRFIKKVKTIKLSNTFWSLYNYCNNYIYRV